jgi:hypothetical protein
VKIKVKLSEYRMYADKALEVYQKDGLDKLQEYCVCSSLNLSAIYTILLEHVQDEEMEQKRDELLVFYNSEITE